MPQYCCVPNCRNRIGGHMFPNEQKNGFLRKKWLVAINRLDPNTQQLYKPRKNDVVCSYHFGPEDYIVREFSSGLRKRLKPNAIPSVFTNNFKPGESKAARAFRLQHENRQTISTQISETIINTDNLNEINHTSNFNEVLEPRIDIIVGTDNVITPEDYASGEFSCGSTKLIDNSPDVIPAVFKLHSLETANIQDRIHDQVMKGIFDISTNSNAHKITSNNRTMVSRENGVMMWDFAKAFL